VLHAGPDRHFYGHAAFSRDGRVLFTSENDIPRGRGVVAVRDADDLRVLAEIPSFGVGPHELVALPDGHTLAIANGGLFTDLADGKRRRDLNVASVCVAASGVAAVACPRGGVAAFFDASTGRLLASHQVRDAGGVATVAGGTRFLVTTGLGETHEFDARTGRRIGRPGRHGEVRWDNHAVLASPA
jgi:hypothetical protein